MRPFRLLLLLAFFVALPVFLTILSLSSVREDAAASWNNGVHPSPGRFRALFSFNTPPSLFPPTAIISLTYDNSTFFLARPAAFGPSLPSKGLSGQLWVGKGFGEELLNENGDLQATGWEFGCSDVPEWKRSRHPKDSANSEQVQKLFEPVAGALESEAQRPTPGTEDTPDDDVSASPDARQPETDDGTDDYLHRPLADSNPAKPAKPGEPASHDSLVGGSAKPTHADIESLQESADIAGKIVMLSRGGCGFLEKVKWAQRRGAIAVIVGDNERGAALTIMYGKGDTSNITIPAIFTSYTSAQILSSLVPADDEAQLDVGVNQRRKPGNKNNMGPTFTTVTSVSAQKPTIVPANPGGAVSNHGKGWTQNVLAKIGMGEEEEDRSNHAEDSRRPPSSGNIDWVIVEDWDEEDLKQKYAKGKSTETASSTTSSVTKTSSSVYHRPTSDDFVIGVQDWRDVDLVAPRPVIEDLDAQKPQHHLMVEALHSSASRAPKQQDASSLKGGSITPGSGEYDHQRPDQSSGKRGPTASKDSRASDGHSHSFLDKLKFWRSGAAVQQQLELPPKAPKPDMGHRRMSKSESDESKDPQEDEHPGLWVTLTPTSVSASPFFDTLLVLVVSPLVTLTIVYALLLLRSRIRRRRWRAPKSVVDQLPVRTFHITSTSSSTTSSQVSTPKQASPAASPFLRPVPRDIGSRPRPRSQTSSDILSSSSNVALQRPSVSPTPSSSSLTPVEKQSVPSHRHAPNRKRYNGRQMECVVCLEEYVDGESRVMSLPCGHEFHAECITPWLVNRRRTCPICKGDVVRSLGQHRQAGSPENRIDGEETSDDIQDRAAETRNESPSAAIPIPSAEDGEEDELLLDERDVERGHGGSGTEAQDQNARQTAPRGVSGWRNIFGSSLSALSGETVWRLTSLTSRSENSTPVDRSR